MFWMVIFNSCCVLFIFDVLFSLYSNGFEVIGVEIEIWCGVGVVEVYFDFILVCGVCGECDVGGMVKGSVVVILVDVIDDIVFV